MLSTLGVEIVRYFEREDFLKSIWKWNKSASKLEISLWTRNCIQFVFVILGKKTLYCGSDLTIWLQWTSKSSKVQFLPLKHIHLSDMHFKKIWMSKCALNAKIEPYLIVASVFKLFQEKKKNKKQTIFICC